MKPLPASPMGQHARFIAAICDDWTAAGKVTRDTPRANAVIEISRQLDARAVSTATSEGDSPVTEREI